MTNSEKVIDYLDKAGIFYVCTEDGDKTKCRPFSFKMEYEGKIYFGVGTFKDVYKQLIKDPNVEICASTCKDFIRYYGKAIFVENQRIVDAAMEQMLCCLL